MQETTLLLVKWLLAFLWLATIWYLVRLDKQFPDSTPTDNVVYYIIGGYIIFVFAWPEWVEEIIRAIANKIWFINNPKKDEWKRD